MKRLFYGVAVSALVIGAGGAAMACGAHDHSAALKNPAAATQAANVRGILLAQTQSDDQNSTSGEDQKKDEALPSKRIGPMAQSQSDDQNSTSGEDQKKDEALPSKPIGQMAQSSDDQSSTSGEGSEDSKPDSEEQK